MRHKVPVKVRQLDKMWGTLSDCSDISSVEEYKLQLEEIGGAL